MHDYYDWRLDYNDRVVRADGRYLTDVFTQEAVGFVERHRGEPFFLHVTYNAPHTPLQAPESDVQPFAETGRFNDGVSTLYGMLRSMDTGVGRILEALEDNGLGENTIVMFTSDNGPQMSGEGDDDTTRFNCHFNGAKGTTYEGGVRVPMVVRWPDGLDGGVKVGEMVHFCDWFPTLLAMGGISDPGGRPLDGVDVLPVLRGEGGKVGTTRFWQWSRYTPLAAYNAAMRDGDWKLVRPRIDEVVRITDEDARRLRVSMYEPERFIDGGIVDGPGLPYALPPPPPPQLYNIAEDPLELDDLAGAHPERLRSMVARLETWFEDVEADRATITEIR
jgi:arylsulfatase A